MTRAGLHEAGRVGAAGANGAAVSGTWATSLAAAVVAFSLVLGSSGAWAAAASGASATTGAAKGAATGATIAGDDFVVRTQSGDTLIGLARRFLRDPARWPDVQRHNGIRDDRRIPVGTALRIPRDWLRRTAEPATVVGVSGRATLDGRPLAAGERAPSGATIETGADGAVTLELADGSTVLLQKSGVLSLERLDRIADLPARDVELNLRKGRLDTHAKPQADGSRFRIRTAVAVSAVRGTEFRTAVVAPRAATAGAADSATTETLGGAVAVAEAGTAARGDVVLEPGFGTRVDEGAPPLPPVQLLRAPDLAALPATNERATLEVGFPAVAGAARYRLQLATDAEFRAIVRDVEAVTPGATFADLADGEYRLRARAIDSLAIEGRDAVRTLVQKRRSPPSPPAIALAGPSSSHARLEWPGTPGASYDVQVARDATFADVVTERRVDAPAFEWRPGGHRWFVRARTVAPDGSVGEYGPATAVKAPWPWWTKTLLPLLLVGALL